VPLRSAQRLKWIAFLALGIALASGGTYAVGALVRWREDRAVSDRIAALTAKLGEPVARAAGAASDDEDNVRDTVNRLLPDVTFSDIAGLKGSIRGYRGSILVVSITSASCPISRKLLPELSRIVEDLKNRGVRFLLVNTDRDATASDLARHSGELSGWRYVHDPDLRLARILSARTTTETFVIDEAQTLRYRGAVDDRFHIGISRQEAGSTYLRDAVHAVLEQRPVGRLITPAPGCRVEVPPVTPVSASVTWHNQISRFVQSNCVECHRTGGSGPFSLETFERVKAKRATISEVLTDGIMPPWFADERYGKWKNHRGVSADDRKAFDAWVAADSPAGDVADAPVAAKRSTGWNIRDPDVVIEADPQQIPAEGYIPWTQVPVRFTVPQDLWVAEAEIRPSAPGVVHHAMLYIQYAQDDPRRQLQSPAESETSGGANGFWLSYFPGRTALVLPPGRGKLIPRNATVYLQMHYVPNGKATVDATRVGFKLLPGPPEKTVITSSVIKKDFLVPPNSTAEFTYSEVLDEDIRLLSLMPHMHYRGTGAQVFLLHADGRSETLLNVPKFDPEWQVSYEYREPLVIPRGARLAIRHLYDNRSTNLRNPDSSVGLRHGNGVNDDMMINFFDWEPVHDPPTSATSRRRPFR
jgi:hypothetical protein